MFAKLFASLYQGTLRGRAHEILVFTNLIAHCDPEGYVDKHFKAISEEVGITVDEVKAAIEKLEAPDPESRSPEEDGRRIVRIDDHRVWGWRIVNYGKYRRIRDEADRREQNRIAQARFREKSAYVSKVSKVSHGKPMSAQAEAEAEEEAEESIVKGKGEALGSIVPIPDSLSTPGFKASWTEWIRYRRKRKLTLVPLTLTKQLEKLEKLGEANAIQAIENSIQNGWQGLFDPKPDGRTPQQPRLPLSQRIVGPGQFPNNGF